MSDRACNLCDFRQRQRDAKKEHKKLKLISDRDGERIMVAEIGTNEWKDAEVWYMKVPSTCQC